MQKMNAFLESISFENSKNTYNITLKLHIANDDTKSLEIKLINTNQLTMYSETFDEDDLCQITQKCQVTPENLLQIIGDHLTSQNTNCRLVYYSNELQKQQNQAMFTDTAMFNVHIPAPDNNIGVFLVIHFNPSPYFECNFAFPLQKVNVNVDDKFTFLKTKVKSDTEQYIDEKFEKLSRELDEKLDKALQSLTTNFELIHSKVKDFLQNSI